MAVDSTPTPRRAVLGAALGGLAALGASALGRPGPVRAAAGQAVVQGQVNAAGATATTVTSSIAGDGAVVGQNSNATGRGIFGKATASTGVNYGVFGQTASASGRGVYGKATKLTGSGAGVRGDVTSPAGYGVYGKASTTVGSGAAVRADGQKNHGLDATTSEPTRSAIQASHNGTAGTGAAIHAYGNTNIGLIVETAHQDNSAIVAGHYGVAGSGAAISAYGNSNIGLYALAETNPIRANSSGLTAVGVWSEVEQPNAVAVLGRSYSATGSATGVKGYSDSSSARAVVGYASAATGVSYGVHATTVSSSGTAIGAVALATSGSAWGVGAESASSDGTGVYGLAAAGSGVTYGVYGATLSPAGFGLYSFGNAHVTGTLSKAAGSFKIDHPLDPAGKYLSHSFVESPDMKNVYDGIATADHRGEATVELPAYFDALNRDLRYQLTPIGRHAPVFIKTEVTKNRFVLGGADPGQRVSWQVTGSRKDAYAEAHPIVVEESKTGEANGRYLHPELHGKPADMTVHQRPDLAKVGREA